MLFFGNNRNVADRTVASINPVSGQRYLAIFFFLAAISGFSPAWAEEVAYFDTNDAAQAGCIAKRDELQAQTTNWIYHCQWLMGANPQYTQIPAHTWGILATFNNTCNLGMCPPDEWVWKGIYPQTQCAAGSN